MSKQLIIIVIFLFITGCASSALKSNNATILSNHASTTTSEELFQLVGVDGQVFEGSDVKAGAHLFYIRGLQTTDKDKKQVNESLHALKVKLDEGSTYQLMSETNDQMIKVWLQEQNEGHIVSDVSTFLVKNINVIELDKVIPDKTERIRVFGKKPHFKFEFKLKDACKFKTDHRNLKRGFEGAISDRRLPARLYTGYNC
jgi:hypothetical protein